MLWGGQRLIRSRAILDVLTLAASGYAINANTKTTYLYLTTFLPSEVATFFSVNTIVLSVACLVTIVTAGRTKRWPISLPLIPIVLLHVIRLVCEYMEIKTQNEEAASPSSSSSSASWTLIVLVSIKICSNVFLGLSALLSMLMPALEISQPKGKYNVGVIDLHLPVMFEDEKIKMHNFDMAGQTERDTTTNGFVSVRFLYPTHENIDKPIPYLNKDGVDVKCKAMMEVCTPPPLNKYLWMLDTWQLSKIQAKRNAQPIQYYNKDTKEEKDTKETNSKSESSESTSSSSSSPSLPVVVFSHGVTGTTELYTYQCMNLASNGSFVILIDHADGSCISMKKHDGSILPFDKSIRELEKVCEKKQVRARRKQTDHRATEVLAVTKSMMNLNQRNIPQLEDVGISFVNMLDVSTVIVGGHSFGAATAVTAAARTPELYSCVIAHDPALDWMPDDSRKLFFAESRFQGSKIKYEGGTAGYEILDSTCTDDVEEKKEMMLTTDENGNGNESKPLFDDMDLLFLYSHQFQKWGWGDYTHVSDMTKRGQLSCKSECGFIYGSHHSEFSDMCMKIPLWLGRAIHATGKRNPHETAEEIAVRTLHFVEEVLERKMDK
jgi:pimeloyl-ACP methyl ester carboxylesterase